MEIKNRKREELENVDVLLSAALQMGGSFALFRLPGEGSKINLHVGLSGLQNLDTVDLEELPKGFIFSEFDGKKQFLKTDISWNSEEKSIQFEDSLDVELENEFNEAVSGNNSHPNFYRSTHRLEYHSEKEFVQLVELGVREIEKATFEKIVPSRSILHKGTDDTKCLSAFHSLCDKYSNAFVSLFSSPETGTWLGATPELLVRTKGQRYFETVSLAGTQLNHEQDLKTVAWTQKEIEEQALVSRYIINCFKKIRLREFEEHGPRTVVAGNLLHLKTQFTVDMEETNFPLLGSTMLKLLHPTSAVCGMPLDSSKEFLKKNENLDRSYYSGYLGPVNANNNTDLFVNLRCMELVEGGALLYAGAGVTIDSHPVRELEETEAKFDTLRDILNDQ